MKRKLILFLAVDVLVVAAAAYLLANVCNHVIFDSVTYISPSDSSSEKASYSEYIIASSADIEIGEAAVELFEQFPATLRYRSGTELLGEDLVDVFVGRASSMYPEWLLLSWKDEKEQVYSVPLEAIDEALKRTLLIYDLDRVKILEGYDKENRRFVLENKELLRPTPTDKNVQIIDVHELAKQTSILLFEFEDLTYNGEPIFVVRALISLDESMDVLREMHFVETDKAFVVANATTID